MLQYIALGILNGCEGLTGYQLKKVIENGVGVFYRASYGSLYPALKKLAAQGCVTMAESRRGGRENKVYSITAKGRQAFGEWLVSPMDVRDNASNHLAKVYFFDALPEKNRRRQIQQYEENSARYLATLLALEEEFARREDIGRHYFKMSTLYYGIGVVQETIRWCRRIRQRQPLHTFIEEI